MEGMAVARIGSPGFVLALALLASPAQAQSAPPVSTDEQEVVVTAIRAGAPVWRVRSGSSMLVMVGAIDNVAAGTDWRPAALAETVRRSNRVMFPQMVAVSVNPFAMVGYLAKWKRRAKLPKGESLATMLGPAETARLARLAAQGLAPADFDRWHPLHLAFNMGDRLRKKTGLMEAATTTVARAGSKHKVARVPLERTAARLLVDDVFNSKPADHLPCLSAVIAAVEAGPEGLRARSRDWAAKRVRATLASPSQRLQGSCWPANLGPSSPASLAAVARSTLNSSGTTLAVLNLDTLARTGGLLDSLSSAGHQVEGPAWR
jgi:hypothetical protein